VKSFRYFRAKINGFNVLLIGSSVTGGIRLERKKSSGQKKLFVMPKMDSF